MERVDREGVRRSEKDGEGKIVERKRGKRGKWEGKGEGEGERERGREREKGRGERGGGGITKVQVRRSLLDVCVHI